MDPEDTSDSEEAAELPTSDITLTLVVDQVEDGNLGGVGVTVLVSGRLISGSMISARRWCSLTAESLRAAGPGAAGLAAIPDAIGHELYPSASEMEAKGLDPSSRLQTNFLHLENVMLEVTGGRPSPLNSTMRIDRRFIAGWTWGTLGTAPE